AKKVTPPIKKKWGGSKKEKYTPKDMKNAIDAIRELKRKKEKVKISIRKIASENNIPTQTLRDTLGRPNGPDGYPSFGRFNKDKKLLTLSEEEMIVNWVIDCQSRAHPVTPRMIKKALKFLMDKEKDCRDNHTINSKHRAWLNGFLLRYRHRIRIRAVGDVTVSRLNVSKQEISQWFEDVRGTLNDKKVFEVLKDPRRVFNIGETNFQMGDKTNKVLAAKGTKHVYEELPADYKVSMTVCAMLSPAGLMPPPLLIYPRETVPKSIRNGIRMDEFFYILGHSVSGYITFEILYEYIMNHFVKFLQDNEIELPVIVFSDWHETQCNYYLAAEMNKIGIHLIGLPPDATHIMQPLDVSCFKPLKVKYKEEADDFRHDNGLKSITLVNFSRVLMPAFNTAMTEENMKSGFRKSGIYPWNADAVDYSRCRAAVKQSEIPE
ncbi:unnamed protein product, partial [Meganyctiphanes norvegica]